MMASVADGFTINEAEYRSYTTPDLDIKNWIRFGKMSVMNITISSAMTHPGLI